MYWLKILCPTLTWMLWNSWHLSFNFSFKLILSGLKILPSLCQRTAAQISLLLITNNQSLVTIYNYVDDIIIYASSIKTSTREPSVKLSPLFAAVDQKYSTTAKLWNTLMSMTIIISIMWRRLWAIRGKDEANAKHIRTRMVQIQQDTSERSLRSWEIQKRTRFSLKDRDPNRNCSKMWTGNDFLSVKTVLYTKWPTIYGNESNTVEQWTSGFLRLVDRRILPVLITSLLHSMVTWHVEVHKI